MVSLRKSGKPYNGLYDFPDKVNLEILKIFS